MKSFKLLSADEVRDTAWSRFWRYLFYTIAFAFLIWPAMAIVAIGIAGVLVVLAVAFVLSIIAIPTVVLLRLLRLV